MEQKQVTLIGLRVKNNGIIQAAELTPDLLTKRLVLITGETGNGKSTLLNSAKIATAGTDAIKKSDVLPDGFISEATLKDGDVPIYIGVKTDTYSRGERAGEQKLTTYLYTKDANGKNIQPVIDGIQWTAAQYWKELTTELTHSLNDLFSENQSTHRKLIEKLFKPELDRLHADTLVAEIMELRKQRDAKRLICQSNGAYMERFADEGFDENTLSLIRPVDIESIRKKITELEIEKAKIEAGPESDYKLVCAQADAAHNAELQKLKDEGLALAEQVRQATESVEAEFATAQEAWSQASAQQSALLVEYQSLRNNVAKFIGYDLTQERRNEQGEVFIYGGSDSQQIILKGLDASFKSQRDALVVAAPVKKEVSKELLDALTAKRAEYAKLNSTPVAYPEKATIDTSKYTREIEKLGLDIKDAEITNRLFARYQMWQDWIKYKELYDAKVDELRKLYASIDTGVPGMKIVPRDTESGKVEVWVMYNAEYNPEYFNNEGKEMRFMFDYSSFQRTVIGLMLQAARLNLKPRALRLAFIDDVAFTPRDISVLTDIAETLDLRLITAWTHEADKEDLLEGQVVVEGGEIFFDTRENAQ